MPLLVHRIIRPRVLLRALLLALVAYAGFAALIWLLGERLIFLPPSERYARDEQILLLPRAAGGTIAAVHLRNPDARYTILFSHGNAENIVQGMQFLQMMRDAGFNVLAYDYSGYGLSTGRPSERAAYADVEAAYDYLTRSAGVPPGHIILHGRSLGGAVAVDLAARRPAGGLVLESTFTSALRVVKAYPFLPFDRFRTERKLPRVRMPVLVIHGTDDEVIGFWHGERLYEIAPGPKRHLWVRGATHNDLSWVAGESYWTALRAFADGLDSATMNDAGR
ncbi:alpha/beta hydrolase [Longimicrobium sp.]|uniref:alpha/beta hydrolase n=1 Tax=Longimicrobium sp. TaxID=2029185 RepID=UPI002E37F8A6|nr:alpha/beta hydrolase [Longimicrobium sp.]HEX6036498.1 alpha/beta hydrolase [Longimicrobium sp.]